MNAYSIMYTVPCMPTPVNPGVAAAAAGWAWALPCNRNLVRGGGHAARAPGVP